LVVVLMFFYKFLFFLIYLYPLNQRGKGQFSVSNHHYDELPDIGYFWSNEMDLIPRLGGSSPKLGACCFGLWWVAMPVAHCGVSRKPRERRLVSFHKSYIHSLSDNRVVLSCIFSRNNYYC
jgi:hypothetical protein